MENSSTLPTAALPAATSRRWPLFIAGVLFFLLGPGLYALQIQRESLGLPWYIPVLSSLGVLFMAISAWQRGGAVRIVGLFVFLTFCGFEWFMIFVAMRAPAYGGPVQVGHSVPAFTTTFADGKPFSDSDLGRGTPTVLLFFRGRW